MTEEWWYWFHDRDWWLSVIQGAIGSFISLLGLFGVYKLTQRAERKRQARERTLAGVASVIEASLASRAIHGGDVEKAEAFGHALMMFALHERHDRKHTGDWAVELGFTSLLWVTDPEKLPMLSRLALSMISHLVPWVSYGCPEGFLTEEGAKELVQGIEERAKDRNG